MEGLTAAQIIDLLSLKPHPEGGHFAETFRDTNRAGAGGRSAFHATARPRRKPGWGPPSPPGFEFASFEMAPPGWAPNGG